MKNKKEFKLANRKMYVGDKTRDIQQKLFEMGWNARLTTKLLIYKSIYYEWKNRLQ